MIRLLASIGLDPKKQHYPVNLPRPICAALDVSRERSAMSEPRDEDDARGCTELQEAHREVHPEQQGIAPVLRLDQVGAVVGALIDAAADDDPGQDEDQRVGDKLQFLPGDRSTKRCQEKCQADMGTLIFNRKPKH